MNDFCSDGYNTDKGPELMDHYKRYLASRQYQDLVILELGVNKGGSLRMWRDIFPKASIIGIDINPVNFEGDDDRIKIFQGSQDDKKLLDQIRQELAPDGFDIIIDDASHIGELTRESFWHLFPNHLKPAGLYVVEDWGTGYWESWPDGESFQRGKCHCAGMVKFIKELIDECGIQDATHPQFGCPPWQKYSISRVEITQGIAFVVKSD